MPDEERPGLSDEVVLAHLGSAVLLCWDGCRSTRRPGSSPKPTTSIGLAPVPDIRSRIVELLLRRSGR